MKADKQLTAARHFEDGRSYVAPDGREILFGPDWMARKQQLWGRCAGRCEHVELNYPDLPGATTLFRCCAEANDPHHIVQRSIRRDDRLENLQALCRYHHDLLDDRKPRWTKRASA